MHARSSWTVAALGVVLATASADAQDLAGRFTLAIQGGTDTEITGDVLNSATGPLLGTSLTIDRRSWRDVYRPKFRAQVLLGYGVTANQEIVVKGTHYKVKNEGVSAGKAAEAEVFAYLTEYEEWGAELIYRFYLASRTRLKSYLGPVVGIRLLDRVLVDFRVPKRDSLITNIPLYKASTVGVFGADIGFGYDLSETVYIGLDTGLRYQTRPGEENALAGFESLDDHGSRWSAPVLVTLGVRF